MQGIHCYVPQTNHVSEVCSVAAVLQVVIHVMLFPILNILCFYISTPRSMCAVPSTAIFCSSWIVIIISNCMVF
jgi:hypothetical protein